MTYKIIKTEEDYQKVLIRIDELMDAEPTWRLGQAQNRKN